MKDPSSLKLPLLDIVPASQEPSNDFELMATNGYLIKAGIVDLGLINQAAEWTAAYFTQAINANNNRVQDAFIGAECVRQLAIYPEILALLQRLYGRRPIPFQTLNFPRGTQQATHPDSFHFNSWPQRWMCGVWVALEDVNELNGPLHYYPGSHRLPILDAVDTSALNNNYQNYESAIDDLVSIAGLKKEIFLPKKGDCLVWAANLLHGGEKILEPQSSRLSQVTHYYFEDCNYFTPRSSDYSAGEIFFRDKLLDITTNTVIQSRNSLLRQKSQKPETILLKRALRKARGILGALKPKH